jgi:hypothetical protein
MGVAADGGSACTGSACTGDAWGGFTHLAFGLCCGCVGQIQSLGDVDQHLLDAGFAYAQQILRVFEQKTRAPERMLHPRAAKFVQVHSQAELLHMDAFEHEN